MSAGPLVKLIARAKPPDLNSLPFPPGQPRALSLSHVSAPASQLRLCFISGEGRSWEEAAPGPDVLREGCESSPRAPRGAGPSPCSWGAPCLGPGFPGAGGEGRPQLGRGEFPQRCLSQKTGSGTCLVGKGVCSQHQRAVGPFPSRLGGWRLCRRKAQVNRASGQTHASPQLQLGLPRLLPPHGSGWLRPKAQCSASQILSEYFKELWVTKPSAKPGFAPGWPHRPWGQVSCTPPAATIHRGRSATS